MKINLAIFEEYKIRRSYDEKTETWFLSVIDIIQALTQQPDHQAARNYWKVLKNRLKNEGSETVTNCNRLKMLAFKLFLSQKIPIYSDTNPNDCTNERYTSWNIDTEPVNNGSNTTALLHLKISDTRKWSLG